MDKVTMDGVMEIAIGVFVALLLVEILKIVLAKFINKATDHFEAE